MTAPLDEDMDALCEQLEYSFVDLPELVSRGAHALPKRQIITQSPAMSGRDLAGLPTPLQHLRRPMVHSEPRL